MGEVWTYIEELDPIKLFLLGFIVLFALSSLLFVVLILVSRSRKIRREIYGHKNSKHIQKVLFSVAFDGADFGSFRDEPEFRRNWRRKIYKEQFLQELIKLHQLYEGEIGENLKQCYVHSGLMQLSFAKIRSRKWFIKCAGIQELSEMNIYKAVPVILEYTKSTNDTLKMVALIEVVHLKGLEGLSLLEDYPETLNDWIQLNLLESIKETKVTEVPDFGYLLESRNESIVVFGLRLLELFHQTQYLDTVSELCSSPSQKIKLQASVIHQKWTSIYGETSGSEKSPLQIPYEVVESKGRESYDRGILIKLLIAILLLLIGVLSYLAIV